MISAFFISIGIAFVVLTLGLLYNLVVVGIAWLKDEKWPDLNDKATNKLAKLLSADSKNSIDWVFELCTACFFLWIGIFVIALCIVYSWLFWIVVIVAAVIAVMHTARWAIRITKSAKGVKNIFTKSE